MSPAVPVAGEDDLFTASGSLSSFYNEIGLSLTPLKNPKTNQSTPFLPHHLSVNIFFSLKPNMAPPPSSPQIFPSFSQIFPYFLAFSLLFPIFSTSTTTTTTTSPPPSSFYSILRSHGLPIGLIPKDITNFTIDSSTGQFEVHLDRACNAKFENQVHYDFNVTGTISYGQIGELSGVSAQELFLWFPVKNIRVDVPSSGLIYFDVGGVVFKQFSLSLFETPPDCVDGGPMENDDGGIVELLRQLTFEKRSGKVINEHVEGDVLRAVS